MGEFSIEIEPDKEGYTGRECPKCEKYFKIKFGTGLPDATDCHCPYCNHMEDQNSFFTKQQIEYVHSLVHKKVATDLTKMLKRIERKPNRNDFISIGITVKKSPIPIAYYSEKELEEKIKCSNCTLEYTIYGAFGYCPDCGIHNSLQILSSNFDLILKILDLASTEEEDVQVKLVENALEDVVSAFDGFGRENFSGTSQKISFQDIKTAKDKIQNSYGFDISSVLSGDQWNFVFEQFQKRHLLAHTMGVIDHAYADKTGGSLSSIGKKVTTTQEDVRLLIAHLIAIAQDMFKNIPRN